MIGRSLSHRLKRLEAVHKPEREPLVFTLKFVDQQRRVTSTLVLGPNRTRTWTDLEDPNGPRTCAESPIQTAR
jgi:hypothetical protein